MNYKLSNETWNSKTKLECNIELKTLIIQILNETNFATQFSITSNYCIYWDILTRYMKTKYNTYPSKTDKFVFLLLLTYPQSYIEKLENFSQLKIAFNEIVYNGSSSNSDFSCLGYHESSEFDIHDNNYCICSQQISDVYEFRNEISGYDFYVGSVCNERHQIIDKDDENYKLMKLAHRDRKYEIKHNLPEGYRQQQRLLKQQNKKTNCKKNEINEEINEYINSKKCYICNKNGLFIQISKGIQGICSKCISTKVKSTQKKTLKLIKEQVKTITCLNCFCETRKLNNSNNLCSICQIKNKSNNCLKCNQLFVQNSDSDNKYCKDCIKTIKQCINCNKDIWSKETYKTKCIECFTPLKI